MKLHHSIQKPTRKNAFEIVRQALSDIQEDNDKRPLDAESLEMLYKYFLPSPPKKAKTAFDVISKCCADSKDVRYYLQNVYVFDNKINGTNGHILAWMDNNLDLETGYYSPFHCESVVESAQYPDVERVKFKVFSMRDYTLTDCELESLDKEICIYIDGVKFNKKYIDIVANGSETITGYIRGKNESAYFETVVNGDLVCFIVMPVRQS